MNLKATVTLFWSFANWMVLNGANGMHKHEWAQQPSSLKSTFLDQSQISIHICKNSAKRSSVSAKNYCNLKSTGTFVWTQSSKVVLPWIT